MAHTYAVYVDGDVYLFGSREEADEYADTKRRDGRQSVKVEAESGPDEEVNR